MNRFQKNQTSLPPDKTNQPPGLLYAKGLGPKIGEGFGQRADNINPALGIRYNFYSSTPIVGITAKTIIGPSPVRGFLLIQNNGSVDIYLGFGTTAKTDNSQSLKMASGDVISFADGIVPANEISAISGTDGQLITV